MNGQRHYMHGEDLLATAEKMLIKYSEEKLGQDVLLRAEALIKSAQVHLTAADVAFKYRWLLQDKEREQ